MSLFFSNLESTASGGEGVSIDDVTVRKPLRPHQRAFLRRFFAPGAGHGMVAAHGVGTGKTLIAVAAAAHFLLDANGRDDDSRGVVLVAPKTLIPNFQKEIAAAFSEALRDALLERITFFTFEKFRTEMKAGAFTPARETFLIVDEAHNIRTPLPPPPAAARAWEERAAPTVTRASAAVHFALHPSVARVLLLTATPLVNGPYDIENLVAICRRRLPFDPARFRQVIGNRLLFRPYLQNVFDFVDADISSSVSIRGGVSEVAFPRVHEHRIEIEMTPSYFSEYARVEHGISRKIQTTNSLTFYTGVRQACNALEPCIKCNWVLKTLEAAPELKTVVYSEFRTNGVDLMRERVRAVLKSRDAMFEIVGDMPQARRQRSIDGFNARRSDAVLFITNAGAEGVDLHGVRRVILLEKGWNRERELQVIGRAVRFGSHTHLPPPERRVDVFHLVVTKPPKLNWGKVKSLPIDSADIILERLITHKETELRGFKRAMLEVTPLTRW